MRYIVLLMVSILFISNHAFAQNSTLKINFIDEDGYPIPKVNVIIKEGNIHERSDENGILYISNLAAGQINITYHAAGYSSQNERLKISDKFIEHQVKLKYDSEILLEEMEVFGEKNAKPKGLELITRLPLLPNDNIQTVSVISNKVIEAQGVLTITDAVRNIPGVTLFGSYGGVKESMSTRGYRGVPVLKNGVRIDSDFRTSSGVTDMQGVESIQMIKGSAAISQGVSTDLGNGGGVINLVTKTPRFYNQGQVSLRYGSWNQVRPSFDIQRVLNKSKTVAIRLNGAYERGNSYRKDIKSNRVYFNPSIAWQPTEKTSIIIEGDYLNDNRTPHTSAINLAAGQDENALYILPKNKFLGFDSDNNNTIVRTFMTRFDHSFNDKLKLRAAFGSSKYSVDNISTSSNAAFKNTDFNLRKRETTRSLRDDRNTTLQLDFIAQDLKTGPFKHIAQIGFDYRIANASTTSFNTTAVDTIDIFSDFTNSLEKVQWIDASNQIHEGVNIKFSPNDPVQTEYNTFGILAQDVIEFKDYLRLFIGLRYSEIYTKDVSGTKGKRQSAWNPSVGLMVSPIKNINIFGSYTNSTSLRTATNLMNDGKTIGASVTQQFEAGIKTEWWKDKLRYNLTYFHILTSNLSNSEYIEGTNITTGYYYKAGDLIRDGIETELNGRIAKDLSVMIGYAYLNARYDNSPSYVNGSAPMNAPKHTANAWVQYLFSKGALEGLGLSAGVYYVGKRPVNEYSLTPDGHGNLGGVKPFDMPGYTTLNAQVSYSIKSFTTRVYINNITNKVGLNSYFRGGFINQTDPVNASVSVSYKF